jgi:hypothetical protein
MRDIPGIGRLAPGPAQRMPRAGTGFRLPDAAHGAEAAGAIATLTPLGLMALQEEDDPAGRNRRGAARGRALLADLAALQAELLGGTANPARLERLARLSDGESPADPALADALAGIVLRARIELARRGLAAPQD